LRKAKHLGEAIEEDIFAEYQQKASYQPAQAKSRLKDCKVEGILYSQDNPSVIIDGTEYHLGDTVFK
jgi:hypothetical protein